MPRKVATGNDRRLKWGDGWIVAKTKANGESSFLARWREPDKKGGTRVASRTFGTEDAAEAHLREVATKMARGSYVPSERLTVETLLTQWIDRGLSEWKPSTVAAYRSWADCLVGPVLGKVYVTALTAPRVQHWVDRMSADGAKPSTIDGAVYILQAAYKEAIRLGMVDTNPVTGTRRPAVTDRLTMPVWTADEVRTIIAKAADKPMWNAILRLHVATGMRPGEIQVLRWSDFDLTTGIVTISRTMTKTANANTMVGNSTKTGRSRAVALPATVVSAMTAWRKVQREAILASEHWADTALVFTTPRGKIISRNSWAEQLDTIIEEAGVKRITLHGIRHTAATLMLEQGINIKIVSDILGHSSIATTMDIYAHVSTDLQRTAIDTLDQIINTTTTTSKTG